jgi:hypothetical protein
MPYLLFYGFPSAFSVQGISQAGGLRHFRPLDTKTQFIKIDWLLLRIVVGIHLGT